MANDGFGYRPPQFSEDSDWLPTWLQPHRLASGEETINGQLASETDCKGFGGFLGSMEHMGEAGSSSSSEGPRRNVCPLFLSDDDCTMTEWSQAVENTVALHLCLSSEDISGISPNNVFVRSTQETYQSDVALDNCPSERTSHDQTGDNNNCNIHSISSANDFNGVSMALIPNNDWREGKKSIYNASQQTPCTELYVPGIVQEGKNTNDIVSSYGACSASFVAASGLLAEKTCPSSAHGEVGDVTLVPEHAMVEKKKNSLKCPGHKRKATDSSEGELREKANGGELSMVDMDVAIELTVAAAEALVISNLVRDCGSTKRLTPSEILEAALKLKQARQACGLDSFSDVSTGRMDDIDHSWFEDLDDNIMEEAFADAGLSLEGKVSPIATCFGDVCKLEDSKDLAPCKNILFLSKDEEVFNDFQGRIFTPPNLGPMADSSETQEGKEVLSPAKMASIDASVSKDLDGIKGNEDQMHYNIQNVQIPLGHSSGLSINHAINSNSSTIGLQTVGNMGSQNNSFGRSLGNDGLRAKSLPGTCKKYDNEAYSQSEHLSGEKLVQCCLHKSANEETQNAATYCNKQVGVDDGGVYHGSAQEDSVILQSSMMCSPSWLNHGGNRSEEIMSPGISQSSQSVNEQWQIQAVSGLNYAPNPHVHRIISTESPRPFNSRWFGGWTGLDVEMNVSKTFEAPMCPCKPFVEETSNLTESLDIATKGSTPVQAVMQPFDISCLDPKLEINDLSSNNRETCNSLSQNSTECSNSPSYDPLCSLVPCSISLEDDPSIANTNVAEMNGINPPIARKLHSHASLQSQENVKTLEKENTIQIMSGYSCSPASGQKTLQTRTHSFSNEAQGCIKRKQVDSLKYYSTLSKASQQVSVTGEIEEMGIDDPNEKLKGDRHDVNIDIQRFGSVCFVESTPVCVSKDLANLNVLGEKMSPSAKASIFNDADALNMDSHAVHHLDPRKIEELNNANPMQKGWDDLGDACEDFLDEEETPPLLLNWRKRRRLRAYRTIESCISEESSWDKTTSSCMDQSVARVFENEKHFEMDGVLTNRGIQYEQEFRKHLSTKLQGECLNRKTVHFSEDTIRCREAVDECQKSSPKNQCTKHSKKQKVCSDVHGSSTELWGSCSLQNANAGMNITQIDLGRCYGEKNEQKLIFQGLEFILTGLSTHKKNKLSSLIRGHGGIVLSDLPSLFHASIRGTKKTECNGRRPPIIVSSQQVHTTKYLYGCAVRSLLLQPGWVIDSISSECCLPYDKYQLRPITSYASRWPNLNHCNKEEEINTPLFTGMRIMLYGKPAFCSKLMILIKHGGGQVFKTIKCLLQGNKSKQTTVAMIIVEDVNAAPRHLRQCASDYRLPVMSGNWIVESLLLGRLLPFRTNVSSRLQSPRKKGQCVKSLSRQPSHCPNISKTEAVRLSGSENITTAHSTPSKLVKSAVFRNDCLSTVCGQGVSKTPLAVPDLGIKLPVDYAEVSVKQKHRANCLYFENVVFKGLMYSIGDVVELEPSSETESSNFVRIECLWAEQAARVKTRTRMSRPTSYSSRMVFMRCRWFYRPSLTGFQCINSGNEIYISNYIHDDVLVQKIKRKVSLVFIVDGRIFPVNAPSEKGAEPSSFIPVDDQKIDFICKFFYDHENESLHQIKNN